MTTLARCPHCNSEKITEFYRGTDNYFSKEEVVFSACNNCSFIFLNPRPTADEYKEMYARVFQNQRRGLDTYEAAVERVQLKGYDHKKREAEHFRAYIDGAKTYLDIGGAWGTLAHAVKELYGLSATIVEPSELAGKVARDYHGFTLHSGDFDSYISAQKDSATFDFVSLSHVFEHTLHPHDFLKKLRSILSDNGYVYIAVPDVTRPFEASDRFFHVEHTFYFSPRTLRQMLEQNGFDIVQQWTNDTDLKVIAKKGQVRPIECRANDLPQIRKAIKKVDRKYKMLKMLKKLSFQFIPKGWRKKAVALASKVFKKIGIIHS